MIEGSSKNVPAKNELERIAWEAMQGTEFEEFSVPARYRMDRSTIDPQ